MSTEMAIPEYPAEKVKTLRDALHLTQTELAEQIGVSRVLVTHWETGRQVPRGPAAILLSQLEARASLDVPVTR